MSDEGSSHENLPDLTLYESLQSKSTELAQELEKHVASIQQKMENMSRSTAEAGKVYKLAVTNLSKEIDESTKMSIELITHCDELDKDLSQLTELSRQIKSVDKALDQLQQVLKNS